MIPVVNALIHVADWLADLIMEPRQVHEWRCAILDSYRRPLAYRAGGQENGFLRLIFACLGGPVR